jgi:hypothetical protein
MGGNPRNPTEMAIHHAPDLAAAAFYVKADLQAVATTLAAVTGQPHSPASDDPSGVVAFTGLRGRDSHPDA